MVEKANLKRAYDLGRVSAMRDFVNRVRSQGGDIALVKLAHDLLMYDETEQSARWVIEQYKDPPRRELIIENPKSGLVLFEKEGITHSSFPAPFVGGSCRPAGHPCS